MIFRTPDCPAPEVPRLPALDADLPFDHPANVAIALERDDLLRAHVKGLNAALECFRRAGAKREKI